MILTYYIVPFFLGLIILFGIRKNNYDSFIKGAMDGVKIALESFPYLLAMILATKLLNGSLFLVYLFKHFDIPYLLFLQGAFHPLSYNASLSIMLEIYTSYGVNSRLAVASSVLQASTDTSFYIIGIYYSTLGIKKYKYSLFMAILSDAIVFCLCLVLFYFIV